MELLIATQNPGKFKEIQEMLESMEVSFVSLQDLGIEQDFIEDGESFEDIALGKAHFYSGLSGLPTVADDSGLFVSALADELGVKTRRWGAGETASDEEWLAHFMQRMEEEEDRAARFVCAAAFVDGERELITMGETEGLIASEILSPLRQGIPLSSVFLPEGYAKVYAALTVEEKNELSHRGKAFSKLLTQLKNA